MQPITIGDLEALRDQHEAARVDQERRLADLETAHKAALAEREAAFLKYDPRDTKPSALQPIEAATAKAQALEAQCQAAKTELDRLRAAEDRARGVLLDLVAEEARLRAGIDGWRHENANALERLRATFREFEITLGELVNSPLAELERRYPESVRAAKAAGKAEIPKPVSAADVMEEVRRALPGDLRLELPHLMQARLIQIKRELLSRANTLAGGADRGDADLHEIAERLDRVRQESEPSQWHRRGTDEPPPFTPSEHALLHQALQEQSKDFEKRLQLDPLAHVAAPYRAHLEDRLAAFLAWPMAQRVAAVPKLVDAARILRALKPAQVIALRKAGLALGHIPPDVVAAMQIEERVSP